MSAAPVPETLAPSAPRLVHPEQALWEQLDLLRSARDPLHRTLRMEAYAARRAALGGLTDGQYASLLDDLPDLLARATPVLWSNEMWGLANLAAETYPREGVRWAAEMLLTPLQYWAYETDGSLQGDFGDTLRGLGFSGSFSTLVGCWAGVVTSVAFLILPGQPFLPIPACDRVGTAVEEAAVPLAAKMDFLRSTVVAQHAVAGGRGVRKDWKRKTGEDAPLVRVVTLRRQHATTEGAAGTVDWSCRWIVSGHWRNQYLPASGGHRPTWIAPHLKGPDSAPLKTPAVTVFVVKR